MGNRPVPIRPPSPNRKFRSWAIIILANLVPLICMTWVLKDAGLSKIWSEVHHMRWGWVCAALLFDAAVYLFHGLRWQMILRPIAKVPYAQSVIAIYVGFFTNEVFPLRAGELVRCFLLSKSTEIPLSVTFASALIERIFDGIWLLPGEGQCPAGFLDGEFHHDGAAAPEQRGAAWRMPSGSR